MYKETLHRSGFVNYRTIAQKGLSKKPGSERLVEAIDMLILILRYLPFIYTISYLLEHLSDTVGLHKRPLGMVVCGDFLCFGAGPDCTTVALTLKSYVKKLLVSPI